MGAARCSAHWVGRSLKLCSPAWSCSCSLSPSTWQLASCHSTTSTRRLTGRAAERLYCKRPILCLASSKIFTPHPPLHPARVSSPRVPEGRQVGPFRDYSVRGQSYVWRLPKYWPPAPASVYPPPLVRGEDTLAGWRGGWGGQYFGRRQKRYLLCGSGKVKNMIIQPDTVCSELWGISGTVFLFSRSGHLRWNAYTPIR